MPDTEHFLKIKLSFQLMSDQIHTMEVIKSIGVVIEILPSE